MAYKPRAVAVDNTARKHVNYDENRTNMRITNLTGETVFMSSSPDVAASGANQGEPIFNNGRFEANGENGNDPRMARFLITAGAGGQCIIGEEEYHG